jgi:hypothetical protein
LTNTLFL